MNYPAFTLTQRARTPLDFKGYRSEAHDEICKMLPNDTSAPRANRPNTAPASAVRSADAPPQRRPAKRRRQNKGNGQGKGGGKGKGNPSEPPNLPTAVLPVSDG